MRSLSTFSSKKITFTASLLGIVMAMSACSKSEQATTAQQDQNTTKSNTTLNIGFQKYGTLPVLKARGTLEQALKSEGVQVRWVEFPAGPQLLEGLNVGSVVFGETGEAPPIFAQAANAKLVYVANQPAAPKAEAIIVPKDSNIKTVAELKGKRVALNKGSNVHYLLLKALEKNGLKLSDIQPIYLPPADARAAFEKGSVDAWVIWDPFFAAAEQQIGAKVLADGEDTVNNYQFYLADRQFAQTQPKVLQTIIHELDKSTQWATQHPTEAAKLLEKPTGLSIPILEISIKRMGLGVTPISQKVITEQQQVADAFYQQKLIPNPLKVQDALLDSTH